MHTPEELLKRAAWKKTPKGRACEKRYGQSPAGRETTRRKNATPATKARKKEWKKRNPNHGRERDYIQRLAIIEFYGGKCLDCGISDVDVLTLDHLEGGGQLHRRNTNSGHKGGSGLYHWVWKFISKDKKPPMNLELVCRNCNWKRHLKKVRENKNGTKN